MKNIAIFASGSGTNAENIISHFTNNNEVKIKLILSNKSNAFVLQRAKNHNINSVIFTNKELSSSDIILNTLTENKIDYIVLAGFLLLMP